MPSRNTVREYSSPAYYHIYNRGSGERHIFQDAEDKYVFLRLLQRYLSDDPQFCAYPSYVIELLAYCVMGNHFHLLLFQENDIEAITKLMRSVSTSYSMYFNKKYKAHGHVFQSVFKSSHITNDAYLAHISRYIHLNPETYRTYRWSSLPFYIGQSAPDWLHPSRAITMSSTAYLAFLEDYEDRRQLLKEIKDQLAC